MMKRVARRLAPGLVLILSTGAVASAHDLWIVPASFRPRPGSEAIVEVRVGEQFPKSMNAPATSLTRFALVSSSGGADITGAARKGKALVAKATAPASGTAAIVLEGPPRHIELSPEDFKNYLLHEGLAHIHEERVRRGEAGKPGRESYSRHAKALIRPAPGEGVATRPAGLKLELVPEVDPYDLSPGEPLGILALFDGQPLGGLELRFTAPGTKVRRVTTGADGRAKLELDRPGPWAVAFIHMLRCEACTDADWRSHFGSLTFELPSARPSTR